MNLEAPSLKKFESEISGFYVTEPEDLHFQKKFLIDPLRVLLTNSNYKQYRFPSIGNIENLKQEKTLLGETLKSYQIEKEDYFLKGTSEPVAYPIIAKNKSIRLPFRWFQIGSVFRPESSETKRYFRQKEINTFIEAHAHFSTPEQAKKQFYVLSMLVDTYLKQIDIMPYLRKVERPADDRFPGSEFTLAYDLILPDNTKTQIATIHYYKDNFSKVYKDSPIKYTVTMGISERVLGAFIQISKKLYNIGEDAEIPLFKETTIDGLYKSRNKLLIVVKESALENPEFKSLWQPYFESRILELNEGASDEANKEFYQYYLQPEKKALFNLKLNHIFIDYLNKHKDPLMKRYANIKNLNFDLELIKAFNSKDLSQLEHIHNSTYTLKIGDLKELEDNIEHLELKVVKDNSSTTLKKVLLTLYPMSNEEVDAIYCSKEGKNLKSYVDDYIKGRADVIQKSFSSDKIFYKHSELINRLKEISDMNFSKGGKVE